MALTPSTMLNLGTVAPDFILPDTEGRQISLGYFKGAQALLIMFICNHCPYVKHIRPGLVNLALDYEDKGVAILAINSNDAEKYPQDSPQKMSEEVENSGYTFPYLFDETQEVAKAYRAACTPDFFLFNQDLKLVYRGQLDSSRPENGKPVTGEDLRGAIDALLSGREIPGEQKPSVGCNIKWKPGNEPDYF